MKNIAERKTRNIAESIKAMSANIKRGLMAIVMVGSSLGAMAGLDVAWKMHPALDIDSNAFWSASYSVSNNVYCMAEGERYLYALISGYAFDKNYAYHNQYYFFPARMDKQDPEGCMEPLATTVNLSGLDAEAMEYAQKGKYVVIAYTNGCVDIIHDDGRILSNTDFLSNGATLTYVKLDEISFDYEERNVYISTGTGFVKIDAQTGATLEKRDFANSTTADGSIDKIRFATETDGKVVMASETRLYCYDAAQAPETLTTEHLVKTASGKCDAINYLAQKTGSDYYVKNPYKLIAGKGGLLYYVGPNSTSNSGGFSLNAIRLPQGDNSVARVINLAGGAFSYTNNMGYNTRYRAKSLLESLVTNTRDGFMFSSHNIFYNVKSNTVEPTNEEAAGISAFKSEVLTQYQKDMTANPDVAKGNEHVKTAATFDGESYYIFRPQEGFQKRTVSGSGNATSWANSEPLRKVNAHACMYAETIGYHPGAGLYVASRGYSYEYGTAHTYQTSGNAVYKNGKWEQKSLKHTSMDLHRKFCYPYGMVVDPCDPQYYFTTQAFNGLARINLEDQKDVMIFTYQGNANINSSDLYVGAIPRSGYFTAPYTEPGFDADGRMWSFSMRADDGLSLMWWDKEDRLATRSKSDYASHPIKWVELEKGYTNIFVGKTVAGQMEKNRNLLAFVNSHNYDGSMFYDHNGTPEDVSDDKLYSLANLVDENGDKYTKNYVRFAMEDPYDGAWIIGDDYGVFTVNREDMREDEVKMTRLLSGSSVGIAAGLILGGAKDIAIDGEGRKWITGVEGGVYVVSADRKELVAMFNSDNSILPEGGCYDVEYNPETNSMFIGTTMGIIECMLPGSEGFAGSKGLNITPNMVNPHYMGYVRVSGMDDSRVYTLEDEEGNVVRELKSRNGVVEFDPSGLARGVYRISGENFVVNK